jgi:hypothetical protein
VPRPFGVQDFINLDILACGPTKSLIAESAHGAIHVIGAGNAPVGFPTEVPFAPASATGGSATARITVRPTGRHARAITEAQRSTLAAFTIAATALEGRLLVAGAAIRYTRRLAFPAYALLAFCAAVEAFAAVALVSLEVYAPTLAAGLGRTATVAAAATVALICLKVYAPLSTASLPF